MRAVVAFLVITLSAGVAAAQSRYSRVKVTPVKTGGKVTGATITLTLHKESAGHLKVNVGLMASRAKLPSLSKPDAMNPKSGKWLVNLGEVTDLEVSKPREVQFKVKYGPKSHVVGGEKYQLVTSWPTAGWKPGAWGHVFGPKWTSWGEPEITMPK